MSATEFAKATGVTRDRLRTWERRHGFPAPVRAQGGPRRYAVADVARVVSLRRAVESGVPIEAAVAVALVADGTPRLTDAARIALAECAPVPIAALSGPMPLRIEYTNSTLRGHPDALVPGDDLLARVPAFAEESGCRTLRRLFTEDLPVSACVHPDLVDPAEGRAQSIAYRLPHEPGQRPLVALVGVDTARERRLRRRLAEVEAERDGLHEAAQRAARWSEAAAAVVERFREEAGPRALSDATGVLVRRLGAVDAAIASYMTGALVIGRSSRGLLGPEMLTVTRFDDLAAAMRSGTTAWLSEATASAFGAPSGLHALIVPILVAGESLGAVLLVMDTREELGTAELRLLGVVAGAVGFALLRGRVAGDLDDERR